MINMKYTVDEKLNYNSRQHTPFSIGYRIGVKTYRAYPKVGEKRKHEIMGDIDDNKRIAQSGNPAHGSVKYAKGFMCGVRDAANERKIKQKRR